MAFGDSMEIRIPRGKLVDASYAIPAPVNIWLGDTARDSFSIVD
jgi:hypothetical protein